MDTNIYVGLIVGLTIATSAYVFNSDDFKPSQKIFLLILFFIPPLQWVSIILVLIYNYIQKQNSVEVKQEKQSDENISNLNSSIESLADLKKKGLLTDEEYNEKIKKIENSKFEQLINNSLEYKQLKSLYENGILTKDEFESMVLKFKDTILTSSNYVISKNYNKRLKYKENIGTSLSTTDIVKIIYLIVVISVIIFIITKI